MEFKIRYCNSVIILQSEKLSHRHILALVGPLETTLTKIEMTVTFAYLATSSCRLKIEQVEIWLRLGRKIHSFWPNIGSLNSEEVHSRNSSLSRSSSDLYQSHLPDPHVCSLLKNPFPFLPPSLQRQQVCLQRRRVQSANSRCLRTSDQ